MWGRVIDADDDNKDDLMLNALIFDYFDYMYERTILQCDY